MIGTLIGPLLIAAAFYGRGFEFASLAMILSIFPVALGIDSILTGLRRRKVRLAAITPNLEYIH
jgi:hypothetical protein